MCFKSCKFCSRIWGKMHFFLGPKDFFFVTPDTLKSIYISAWFHTCVSATLLARSERNLCRSKGCPERVPDEVWECHDNFAPSFPVSSTVPKSVWIAFKGILWGVILSRVPTRGSPSRPTADFYFFQNRICGWKWISSYLFSLKLLSIGCQKKSPYVP